MKLYHYTCLGHLPSIIRCGFLKLTQGNLRIKPLQEDPDVVWLTSNPQATLETQRWSAFNAALPILARKLTVRFVLELEVADKDPRISPGLVYAWSRWFDYRNGDKKIWKPAMKKTGGAWESWYVSERPVFTSHWVRIELTSGEVLWTKEDGFTDAGSAILEALTEEAQNLKVREFKYDPVVGRHHWMGQ